MKPVPKQEGHANLALALHSGVGELGDPGWHGSALIGLLASWERC